MTTRRKHTPAQERVAEECSPNGEIIKFEDTDLVYLEGNFTTEDLVKILEALSNPETKH